jgi:hypothetical protein
MKKTLLMIGIVAALLPMTAAARGRVGFYFGGPVFGPYWHGWYDPYFYGYGPYGYAPFGYYPSAGQVKLDTKVKDAEVWIDGSYAGTVGQLKTMTMRPGSYDIQLRAAGRAPFEEKIYVTAGKTVTLRPDLALQSAPGVNGDRIN